MFRLRYATPDDQAFWFSLDGHIRPKILAQKMDAQECYILEAEQEAVGILRYNLFWDTIPFLNLLILRASDRRKGLGRQALLAWESEMKKQGYAFVMTSTMAAEEAQHFYRKLGYKDCGCLLKDIPPLSETIEIFLVKVL